MRAEAGRPPDACESIEPFFPDTRGEAKPARRPAQRSAASADSAETARDARMMRLALQEAEAAFAIGEVPIGAVIARGDEVIALAHNERETGRDATLHAECIAVRRACERLGGWRLQGCTLYVTLEPCPMCAGAAINARIERVVYGARDPKAGSTDSLVRLFELPYNHLPRLTGGVLENDCAALMTRFFERLRAKRSVRRMKKLDLHACVSLRPDAEDSRLFPTADELRTIYDRLGVDRGVAAEYEPLSPAGGDLPSPEQVCSGHPGTVGRWFCSIDVEAVSPADGERLGELLARYRAAGARGVCGLNAGIPADDPRCMALFGQAERLGLPVLLRIGSEGEPGLPDEPGLPRLRRALDAFPGLTFIVCGRRIFAEILADDEPRGGSPDGEVTPAEDVPGSLRRYRNLHLDLSGESGWDAVTRDPDRGLALLEELSDRLHFACGIRRQDADAPFLLLSRYLDEAALRNRLSDRAYRAICRDNTLRLLGERVPGETPPERD